MSLYDYIWKIMLRKIPYEKEGTRYTAEVQTWKTPVDIDEIARQIIYDGSEIKYATLMNIINRYEELIGENLCRGKRVQTPNFLITPQVTGIWPSPVASFDPKVHQRTVKATPTLALRKLLERVGVQKEGIKDHNAHISLVINLATGLHNHHMLPDDDLSLEGKNIKVTKEDSDSGVFFINENKQLTAVEHHFVINTPTQVVIRVPANLAPGTYRLMIRTHFIRGGKQKSKELHTIFYPHPLTVDAPDALNNDPV
ncbi:DUF4469 domain-containing protein [uncultured Parabacteroides sp.]|uniref:DUF4469 domain-containing protein n=1 Tax=uncultured Parabacteroides sp. TaxID=512312 RepID=UPI002599ACE3|nr:DUF4469 domain-containing protein [uncultured Parabacteroides sp.]